MKQLKIGLMLVILCVAAVTHAQNDEACPVIVEQILADIDELCADTGRNQVCYGHPAMEVIAREGARQFQFEGVGDIEDANAIQTLRLSAMDEGGDNWGVALMRLQASLPDSLPGRNVTFVLFGDVQLTNAVAANNDAAQPMQAFYLKTGAGQQACKNVTESGLLVQTPKGVGEVTFAVNGVEISLGSTVFLSLRDDNHRLAIANLEGNGTAQPTNTLAVQTLEGMAVVANGQQRYPVVAGTQFTLPLDDHLLPTGDPGELMAMDDDLMAVLPLELVEADRVFAEPVSDEDLQNLIEYFDDGGVFCGKTPLPSCEDYPWLEDWALPDMQWGDEGFGDTDWLDYEDLTFDDEAADDEMYDDVFVDEAAYGDQFVDDDEYIDEVFDDGGYDAEAYDDEYADEAFDDTFVDDEAYDDAAFDDSGYDDGSYADEYDDAYDADDE